MTLKGRFIDALLKLESVTANNTKDWKQPTNCVEFIPYLIGKKELTQGHRHDLQNWR
jgi:hypothetical protein